MMNCTYSTYVQCADALHDYPIIIEYFKSSKIFDLCDSRESIQTLIGVSS